MTIQMLPYVGNEENKIIIRNNADNKQINGIGIEVIFNGDEFFYDYNQIRYIYPKESVYKPLRFIRTADIEKNNNTYLFDAIAMTDDEHYIIEALNIINDKIKKINFISDTTNENSHQPIRSPFVVINGDERRYRLSSMGDGMNRILTIILSMLNSKNGVFFVDEFENGLHHSVQQKLWEMIFYLAKELDIQVFATTHSDDCIKSFIKADKNNQGKLIRLERHGENINAIPFNDRERLEFAIENDIEIR